MLVSRIIPRVQQQTYQRVFCIIHNYTNHYLLSNSTKFCSNQILQILQVMLIVKFEAIMKYELWNKSVPYLSRRMYVMSYTLSETCQASFVKKKLSITVNCWCTENCNWHVHKYCYILINNFNEYIAGYTGSHRNSEVNHHMTA